MPGACRTRSTSARPGLEPVIHAMAALTPSLIRAA